MLIELIYHVVLWLNAFLTKTGFSKVFLPCKIVFFQKLKFAKHCQAVFGLYCKIHDKPTPTNMMVTWASLKIILDPTGNLLEAYKFYNLVTGKKIKRCMFMPYLMPDLVIKKFETFGVEKQDSFDFAGLDGVLFEWNDKVDALKGEVLVKEDIVLYPSIMTEFPGVDLMHHTTSIEKELEPHNHIEDAAAHNTNFGPVVIAGVDTRMIHASPDKINGIGDEDNKKIHVRDIHLNQHPTQKPNCHTGLVRQQPQH